MRGTNFAALVGACFFATSATAQVTFSDNFDAGASPLWGNESGSWIVADGRYSAELPSNWPNAYSSLPFVLANCAIDVDIAAVNDGGIWLRSAPAPGTPIGVTGVLLVTGANGFSFYWHIVPDGSSYGSSYEIVWGLFPPGSDIHVRVEVVGDAYSVYLNGETTPASTLTTSQFPVGRVGLYDYSGQSFDNVVVTGFEPCAGDLDRDGLVGPADLAILLGGWGEAGATDLDQSGSTDASDLALLLGAWGSC
ncbi:MAG: hypothetical protein U0572_14900 [Phycisphaerales bacterium]